MVWVAQKPPIILPGHHPTTNSGASAKTFYDFGAHDGSAYNGYQFDQPAGVEVVDLQAEMEITTADTGSAVVTVNVYSGNPASVSPDLTCVLDASSTGVDKDTDDGGGTLEWAVNTQIILELVFDAHTSSQYTIDGVSYQLTLREK